MASRSRILISVVWAGAIFAQSSPSPQLQPPQTLQDKNKQTLVIPRDPPLVSVGESSKLIFHVSPLSAQGLLSQQTRDALKAILKATGGAPMIHIRAFSAGNGDIRRIPQIVADVLGDKHGPLPSVSVLQVGGLPVGDAQVVLEVISAGRKDVNRDGVAFHPAETVIATDSAMPPVPLLQKSIDQLAAKMSGRVALSVTCFASSLDNAPELLRMMATRFPGAVTDLVQPRRLAWQTEVGCEGVTRGGGSGVSRLAFSGTQVGFGVADKDAALAVQRLDHAMAEAGAPLLNAVLLHLYMLSPGTASLMEKQLTGTAAVVPLPVEGVGAMTAGFAIDAVSPLR